MNQKTWRIPYYYGETPPGFHCQTPQNPRFHLHALGGHYTVLSFIDSPNQPLGKSMLNFVFANAKKFGQGHIEFFAVISERPESEKPIEAIPGITFFLDYDRRIARLYHADDANGYHPYTLVLDHMMRVIACLPITDMATHTKQLAAILDQLPRIADNPPNEGLHAPVLILPRIFEPAFCRELINQYEQHGGESSGYMREVNGKTFPVLNAGFKRRKDFNFHEGDAFASLREQVAKRISFRLVPQIKKAFQFNVTRMERYTVACYSGEDEGFFRAHRDNTTPATRHRRFACTINLNAEEYDGGELRFPEFGRQTYRAPTGGVCVFSCSLLHEATPVTNGNRYAFLPFFYDDAAAAIRDENKDSLVDKPVYE